MDFRVSLFHQPAMRSRFGSGTDGFGVKLYPSAATRKFFSYCGWWIWGLATSISRRREATLTPRLMDLGIVGFHQLPFASFSPTAADGFEVWPLPSANDAKPVRLRSWWIWGVAPSHQLPHACFSPAAADGFPGWSLPSAITRKLSATGQYRFNFGIKFLIFNSIFESSNIQFTRFVHLSNFIMEVFSLR